MSDWLNSDDSGDGGFLGHDDSPAAPTAPALQAPDPFHMEAPMESNSGDWLGIADPASAPAADGGWMDAPLTDGGFLDPAPADAGWGQQAPAPMQSQHAAPQQMQAAPFASELTIEAPYLEQMHPGVPSLGSLAGADLSSVVLDVEVPVEVFFGDAALTVEQFLELDRGAVIELDHAIEAPIELRVRNKVVARGQLVSINGSYGLRVTELVEGVR